jgi:hypothetical protein
MGIKMKKLLAVLVIVVFISVIVIQPVTAPQRRDLSMGDTIGNIQSDTSNNATSDNQPAGSQTTPSQSKVIIMAPSADDSTDQETAGINGGEMGVLANEDSGAEPVHMPLEGGTQGSEELPELDDEVLVGARDAEKEYTTDVIIKGSTVKENYADKDHNKWIEILSVGVKDEKGLEMYAAATAATDENVEEIELSANQIVMKYKQPAKLLGFIPVNYTTTVTVDTGEEIYPDKYGRVKVKFPWWLIFARDGSKDLKSELEQKLSSPGGDAQLANINMQNSVQKQQELLQMMSNIMKAKHDTAKASINNIR